MSESTMDRVAINTFTGMFLTVVGIGYLAARRDVFVTTLFVLVGVFFLTRALAQYNENDNS